MDSSTPMVAARPTTITIDGQKRRSQASEVQRGDGEDLAQHGSASRQGGCDIHPLEAQRRQAELASATSAAQPAAAQAKTTTAGSTLGPARRRRAASRRGKICGEASGASPRPAPRPTGRASRLPRTPAPSRRVGKADGLERGEFGEALAHRLGDAIGGEEQDHEHAGQRDRRGRRRRCRCRNWRWHSEAPLFR